MYKKDNKKCISPVVATALLLVVGVTSVVYFQGWFTSFQSNLFSGIETRVSSNSVTIEYLEPNKVYIRNYNNLNLTLSDIKIGGILCGINGTIGNNGVYPIDLGTCLTGMQVGPKEVVVYTKNGIFSQTKMLRATLNSFGNLTVSFDIGSSCLTGGYTKIYGLEGVSDSHVEIASSNLYSGQSLCLNHNTYTLGTSCSGNFQRLFYLDDSTDAHAYTDNSTSYLTYSTWEEVCVSSSGGIITTSVSSTDPLDGSSCIGSFETIDDINGVHMGSCSAYATKVWLKIE